jgi:hypothetical protein
MKFIKNKKLIKKCFKNWKHSINYNQIDIKKDMFNKVNIIKILKNTVGIKKKLLKKYFDILIIRLNIKYVFHMNIKCQNIYNK